MGQVTLTAKQAQDASYALGKLAKEVEARSHSHAAAWTPDPRDAERVRELRETADLILQAAL